MTPQERQGEQRASARASFTDPQDHVIASDLEMAAYHRDVAAAALREADHLLWQAANRAVARRWPLYRLAAFIARPQKVVKRWLQTPDLATLEG